ncbi:Uncharacterised protein [Serratia fonticola]|nr:Uncharacterised protein [Serratia fonticola]
MEACIFSWYCCVPTCVAEVECREQNFQYRFDACSRSH